MLRIAVCDDEKNFIISFVQILNNSFADFNCEVKIDIFTCGSGLLSNIERENIVYDVIFLDIEMPTINGYNVAKRLREFPRQTFLLIFNTYMDNEIAEGYKYKAFRFVLKKRLKKDIEEATKAILEELNILSNMQQYVDIKFLHDGISDTISLMKDDILYFFKKEKSRRIIMKTIYDEYELLVKPLTYYQQIIDSNSFDIFVRNYLLNMNKIENYDKDSFILTGGVLVPLGNSRETKKESKERYLRFLAERW